MFNYFITNEIKNPNCGGSYIDSPDWIKNKEPRITLINENDNKCF